MRFCLNRNTEDSLVIVGAKLILSQNITNNFFYNFWYTKYDSKPISRYKYFY